MRWSLLACLAACGSPPPLHPTVPARSPVPSPQSPGEGDLGDRRLETGDLSALPTFEKPGQLFLLMFDGTKPRCQVWNVDAENHELTAKAGATATSMTYRIHGTKLFLDDLRRIDADGEQSTTCSENHDVKEEADALVVDGAKWFRSVAACDAAIAAHARVATMLSCEMNWVPSEKEAAAARPKFEKILGRGGTMYSIVESPKGDICQRVKFSPSKRTGEMLEGELSYPIEIDHVKGTEAYTYELAPGGTTITLLGPGRVMQDGNSLAFGCGGQNAIQLFSDHVEIADALYFTQTSCRAAIERTAQRASWLPLPEGEPDGSDGVAQSLGAPAIGGC
jgi:hypothetical protein